MGFLPGTAVIVGQIQGGGWVVKAAVQETPSRPVVTDPAGKTRDKKQALSQARQASRLAESTEQIDTGCWPSQAAKAVLQYGMPASSTTREAPGWPRMAAKAALPPPDITRTMGEA